MTLKTLNTSALDADSSLIRGPWTLQDLREGKYADSNGLKVFSCFHCGGGSTMGYKLAGFEVLGGVEIDPQMMGIYRQNHNPKYSYLMSVEEFKTKEELPAELFELDILDGSPPCSSFSMAGSREDAWGEKKKFREGQAEQVLDDLFFHFIEIAKKLKPKIVVAENVKGLVMGNAKGYVKEIFSAFKNAGYEVQLFLLNASRMGVPQARERTFFIARRADLNLPKLNLEFNESIITVARAIQGCVKSKGKSLMPSMAKYWPHVKIGDTFAKVADGNLFSWRKVNPGKPSATITATHCQVHWSEQRLLSPTEVARLQTFPDDYNYGDADPVYVCGMSVPPLMMNRVALKIADLLRLQ